MQSLDFRRKKNEAESASKFKLELVACANAREFNSTDRYLSADQARKEIRTHVRAALNLSKA